MQPNDQNGYWRPQQDQPIQPAPPQPQQQPTPQPVAYQQPAAAQPPQYQQAPQPAVQPQFQTVQPDPVAPQPIAQQPEYTQQPAPQPQQQPTPQPVAYQQPVTPAPLEPQQPTQPPVDEQLADEYEQVPEDEEEYYDDEEGQEEEIDDSEAVNWQATEYIHQDKGAKWFVIFGIVFVAFEAMAIFLMNSPTFAVLLVVVAVAIVVFAKRPPRILSYSLSGKGLHIGDTLHNFADFKSFGVIHDGAEYSVMLIPTKRFQPGVTVYFPEESGEAIVDMLGARLPMQDLKLDAVDKITRFLRL